MRTVPLTTIKGGIDRQRVKGGARADNLYDLLNGYVTEADTVAVRPGTFRRAVLPAGTKGLCSFKGLLHTFSSEPVDPLLVPDGYRVHVLKPPFGAGSDYDGSGVLKAIHFAEPFLGVLYVVAEFEDGSIYHYWLQLSGAWEANKAYKHGDIVEPTTPNGLAYRATRIGSPYPSWAPNVPRTADDEYYEPSIVEPTVYNDFYYVVIDTIGANPASGATEPEWPTEPGAQVFEDTDGFPAGSATTTQPPSTQTPGSDILERYGIVIPNIPIGF